METIYSRFYNQIISKLFNMGYAAESITYLKSSEVLLVEVKIENFARFESMMEENFYGRFELQVDMSDDKIYFANIIGF